MNLIQFESSHRPVIDASFNFITLFKCLQNWKLDYLNLEARRVQQMNLGKIFLSDCMETWNLMMSKDVEKASF